MSNELATVDTNKWIALQEGGDIAEAMAANMGTDIQLTEGDLTRVQTPAGGGTTWMVPNILGDEAAKTIEGILVYQCPRGLLWAGNEPTEGEKPVLTTDDLVTAKLWADDNDVDPALLKSMEVARNDDGTYRWADLPQCQWGSGRDGVGKAAKDQRVLFILREGDALPLVVTIQPGSLKNWSVFITDLSKAGVPFYRAVVSLGLEKATSTGGTAYAKVVPSLTGVLTKDEGQMIRDTFTGKLAKMTKRD